MCARGSVGVDAGGKQLRAEVAVGDTGGGAQHDDAEHDDGAEVARRELYLMVQVMQKAECRQRSKQNW